MQTKPTGGPTGSPSAGTAREPVRIHDDAPPAAPPRRRSPASRLLSALRGDKYMVDAYPPGKER